MDLRKLKGMEIAATTKLHWSNGVYEVPSQSGRGTYKVRWKGGDEAICTCPDSEVQKEKCKHIHAVEFSRFRDQLGVIDPLPKRPTYRQNWTAYNAAQVNEKDRFTELLKGLCEGIVQPHQGRGRPRLPLSDVVFSAVMKTYTTVSGRRAASDIRECARKGHLDAAPHYNSIFKYLENPSLTPILKALIEQSALPLRAIETDFAVDSSGFGTSTFERWYDAKYGKTRSDRYWIKAHLMVGVRTNIVTSVEITGPNVSDYPQLPGLLRTTQQGFNVAEVSADKGYTGISNLEAIVQAGATPYIPFKSNTTGKGSELWKKLWHFYEFNRADFLASYHKRSNVETTFSMIKAKFGSSVRSKTHTAQMNEVLCKIVCHNLSVLIHSMYDLDLEPIFWAESKAA
jgi:transposase